MKTFLFFLILISCFFLNLFASESPLLAEEAHLFFLRDSFDIEGQQRIGYWIYADAKNRAFPQTSSSEPNAASAEGSAPLYQHAQAKGEGVTCLDDVARAGIYFLYQYENSRNAWYLQLAKETIEFALALRTDNGDFNNFVLENGQINRQGTTSSASRNWWALRALLLLSEGVKVWKGVEPEFAYRLFSLAITTAKLFQKEVDKYGLIRGYTDLSALYLIGLCNLYEADFSDQTFLREQINFVADGLLRKQILKGSFEGLIDEGNEFFYWSGWGSRQVQALVRAYDCLQTERYLIAAKEMADRFYPLLLSTGPWYAISELSFQQYPQIAYAAEAMVTSCYHLYRATTEKPYALMALLGGGFFFGNNPLKRPMVSSSGAGFDGLEQIFINQNSGAESTLSYLLTEALLRRLPDSLAFVRFAIPVVSNSIAAFEAQALDAGLSAVKEIIREGETGLLSKNLRLRVDWLPTGEKYRVILTGRFPKAIEGKSYYDTLPSEAVSPDATGFNSATNTFPSLGILTTQMNVEKKLTFSVRSSAEFFLHQILLIPEVPYQVLRANDSYYLWASNRSKEIQSLQIQGEIWTLQPREFLFQALPKEVTFENSTKEEGNAEYDSTVLVEGNFQMLQYVQAYNANGIGSARQNLAGEANFDNYGAPKGAYYPEEEVSKLVKEGIMMVDKVPFFIDLSGEFDHLLPSNQKIVLPLVEAQSLWFLGSSDHGNYTISIEVEYSDGTKEWKQVGFSDWCGSAVFGEQIAVEFPFRYLSNGEKEWINCKLYKVQIPLQNKPIKSIFFPVLKTLHIFGITFVPTIPR